MAKITKGNVRASLRRNLRKNETAEEQARRLDLNPTTLRNIYQERHAPSRGTIAQVQAALDAEKAK